MIGDQIVLGQITDDSSQSTSYEDAQGIRVDEWNPPEDDTGIGIFLWMGAAIVIFVVVKIVRTVFQQRVRQE
jgi:hypothetical protein